MSDGSIPRPGVMLRNLSDRLLSRAADVVDDLVASDAFSIALARGMALTTAATSAVRRSTNQVGEFAAEWLNIPTRRQLIELARRMNHIEIVLDDIDVKAEEVLSRLHRESDDG